MFISRQKLASLLRKAGCELWLSEIFLYADDPGNLAESQRAALERHLSSCENCRLELDAARKHLDVSRHKPVPAWVKGLAESSLEAAPVERTVAAGLRQAAHKLAESFSWVSMMWYPRFAGHPVTAGDIAEQSQAFRTTTGDIVMTCRWQGPSGDKPAFLRLSWRANVRIKGELIVRFTHAETKEILADIPLGRALEGVATINSRRLGFDPSSTPWAMCLMLT